MWVQIDLASFSYTQSGLSERTHENTITLTSDNLTQIKSVRDLKSSEYGVAIEIDLSSRRISFGRDYLGHYPLLYASTQEILFISDEIEEVRSFLINQKITPKISQEAVSLYFTMEYIPQGMTLIEQIVACENASIYHYKNGAITKESTFTPITINQDLGLNDLEDAIHDSVKNICRSYNKIDVWCSGGLDSSLIAYCSQNYNEDTRLLTMRLSEDIEQIYDGLGELPYLRALAQHIKLPYDVTDMTHHKFSNLYHLLLKGYIGPTFNKAIVPKLLLASTTRTTAITGEGGDHLFGGTKNTFFMYMQETDTNRSPGWHYAKVHHRLFDIVGQLLNCGDELIEYIEEYFNRLFEFYPGSSLRKLFYIDTFLKQGSLIFPKNYYAGKSARVNVYHPLTSLHVYQTAFCLPDNKKYIYPEGKLALKKIFSKNLPNLIIDRKKSGTQFPVELYIKDFLSDDFLELEALKETNLFNIEFIEKLEKQKISELPRLYLNAFATLNLWIKKIGSLN